MSEIEKLFNEIKRDSLWERKGKKIRLIFGMQIEKYTKEWIDKYSNKVDIYGYTQCDIGYNAMAAHEQSGIITKYSKENPDLKCTKEHYMGAKLIGKLVIDSLVESNYDYDWMVNTWLYENLWLWVIIKVTKEEDSRLGRNKHTLEEKLSGVHYKEAGIILVKR